MHEQDRVEFGGRQGGGILAGEVFQTQCHYETMEKAMLELTLAFTRLDQYVNCDTEAPRDLQAGRQGSVGQAGGAGK